MSSIINECAPSRWLDFLNIPNNAVPTASGEDKDLFVGSDKSVTITLQNGTVTKFRDVVVLGELIIQSSQPENSSVRPSLIVRNFFNPSKVSLSNIHISIQYHWQPKNTEEFRKRLQELFLDWISFQRESVEQIGLKSILV